MSQQFIEFIQDIKAPVLIVYHTDTDGVCSAVIACKAIERMTGFKIKSMPCTPGLVKVTKKLFEQINKKGAHTLIFVDVAVDQEPEYLLKLKENHKIMVIDHHPVENDLNKQGIVHINPKFDADEKRNYPVSKLVYDLFSDITDISDMDWVSCVGLIADSAAKEWKRFLTKTNKKYSYYPYPEFESYFDLPLGEIGKWINSSRLKASSKGLRISFRAVYESTAPEDILKCRNEYAQEIKGWNEDIQKQIKEYVDGFEKNSEKVKSVYFYSIKGENSVHMKSTVATIISNKHPGKTIFVFGVSDDSEFLFFSGRRSDGRIDLRKAIQKSISGLQNASGGGHRQASAGIILKKDEEEFKKRVAENTESF